MCADVAIAYGSKFTGLRPPCAWREVMHWTVLLDFEWGCNVVVQCEKHLGSGERNSVFSYLDGRRWN